MPNTSPDWAIEIDAVNGPCYVSDSEGDPGRTHDARMAERYSTRNEADENMYAFWNKYPQHRYKVVPFPAIESTAAVAA